MEVLPLQEGQWMKLRRHFCTLFDHNYLLKGLVMLESLLRYSTDASVDVLCMNEVTHDLLAALQLPRVHLLRLGDVEDTDLLRVKAGRSIAEYCWTLSPALCWNTLHRRPEIEMVTYLDADLMFFSDVEPLFRESEGASIVIIEHRFAPKYAYMEAWGRFNVEWVGFGRSAAGLTCLKTWRNQCIEWCFARLEEGRLGDQKYLDSWPAVYANDVHILGNVGAGIAPWNFQSHQFEDREGQILVDGVPLIFYHFNQFQLLRGNRFDRMSALYSEGATIPSVIYARYEHALLSALHRVRDIQPEFSAGIRSASAVQLRRAAQRFLPVGVKNVMRRIGIQPW
jgi:hypothetical protein